MTRGEWEQGSFLAPAEADGGSKPVKKKKPKNLDLKAVFGFMTRERAGIYEEAPPPNFNQLTPHQQDIYRAIQSGEEKQAEAWREQRAAAGHGLTQVEFMVDEITVVPGQFCGHCSAPIVRDVRMIQKGRGKKSGQTQLLVNDYCASCNAGGAREYRVWVPSNQVIQAH
jgi:hypothetical protein